MSYPPVSDSPYQNAPDVPDVESSPLVPGKGLGAVEDTNTNSNFMRSLQERTYVFPEPEQQFLKRAWALCTEHIVSFILLYLVFLMAFMGTIIVSEIAIYVTLGGFTALAVAVESPIVTIIGSLLLLLVLGVLSFVFITTVATFPAGLMHALHQTARTGQAPEISDMFEPLRRNFPIFSLRLILVSFFTAIATTAVPLLIIYAGMIVVFAGLLANYGFIAVLGGLFMMVGYVSLIAFMPFGMWALAVFVDRNMNGPGISAFGAVRASFIITWRAGFLWMILLTIGSMLLAQSGMLVFNVGILFTAPLSAMWLVCIYDGLVGLSR